MIVRNRVVTRQFVIAVIFFFLTAIPTAIATRNVLRDTPEEFPVLFVPWCLVLVFFSAALSKRPRPRPRRVQPGFGNPSTEKALALLDLGRSKEAEQQARHLVGVDPSNGEAWEALALAVLQEGRSREAVDIASRALNNDPNSTTALHVRSLAHAQLNAPQKALDDIRRATTIAPSDPYLLGELSQQHLRISEATFGPDWAPWVRMHVRDALAATEAGLSAHPTNSSLLALRGAALIRSDRAHEGVPLLIDATAKDPQLGPYAAHCAHQVISSPWQRRKMPREMREQAELLRDGFR